MSQAAPRAESAEKAAGVEPLNGVVAAPISEWTATPSGEHRRIDCGVELPHRTAAPVASEPSTSAEFLTGGDSLERFVAKHGHGYDSYQATEPGRLVFWSRRGLGLVSYIRDGQCILVSGGLIAPNIHKETLLREFVEQLKRDKLRAAFLNINEEDAPLFRKLGFNVTKWGQEPLIDLRTLTWGGKPYEWVRRQSNYCLRNGVVATEVRPGDLNPEAWEKTLAEIHEVARESLSNKAHPQGLRFVEGCIDHHELGLRRLFVARSDQGQGRIEAFVICNPLRNGTMWSTELYRHRLDSVRGTVAFLFHHLMEQMRQEGVERVHLCLDPGRDCTNPMPGDSRRIRRWLQRSEKYLGFLFDFAGVRHFRSRFRPRYENLYVCAQPGGAFFLSRMFIKATGCLRISFKNLFRILSDRFRKRSTRKNLAGND